MVIRKKFLEWIKSLQISKEYDISPSQFFDINEKKYVFNILDKIIEKEKNCEVLEKVKDFKNIEKQRYYIFENHIVEEEIASKRIENAILFCQLEEIKKKKACFIINKEINNYEVQSKYYWNSNNYQLNVQISVNYLIIPSFLKTSPKEINVFDSFNSLLLDLKNYDESFTYESLLNLVAKETQVRESNIDSQLMQFVINQALYYQTFLIET